MTICDVIKSVGEVVNLYYIYIYVMYAWSLANLGASEVEHHPHLDESSHDECHGFWGERWSH